MKSVIMFLLFLGAAMAAGQQPCYNAADPDNGIGNYCECNDGTWSQINNINQSTY